VLLAQPSDEPQWLVVRDVYSQPIASAGDFRRALICARS
jgi:hypothetical protein